MLAAQDANGYPYYNGDIRATKTDAFVCFAPVMDYAVLFRPFHLGFLLLGLERGYAFFWSCRIVVLFLLSIEFANRIIQKGATDSAEKRIFAFSFALAVTFSSMVQWWSCSPEFWAMFLALILFDIYLENMGNGKIQLLCTFLICWAAGCFGMWMYPAWIIPIGYVIFAFVIWIFVIHIKSYQFSIRDVMNLILGVGWLGISLGYILGKSSEAMESLSNTLYPGMRLISGGEVRLLDLFAYGGNLFFPTDEQIPMSNVCNFSMFFPLFPINIYLTCLSFFEQIKQRKKPDLQIILLVIISGLFLWYMILGLPDGIAKLSLLSHSSGYRVLPIWTFSELLILFRAIFLLQKNHEKVFNAINVSVILALSFLILFCTRGCYLSYLSSKRIIFLLVVVVAISISILLWIQSVNFAQILMPFCFLGIAYLGGMRVNPIQHGLEALTGHTLFREIAEITQKDEDGVWLAVQVPVPIINVPVAAGAKQINCTNFYPNLDLWKKIDQSGEYEEDYNRYAHIIVYMQSEKETYFNGAADCVVLYLNPKDLESMNVKYILTNEDLTQFELEKQGYTPYRHVTGNYAIYRENRE